MPPHLYKYERFSARSLENLKAQSIYFGSPSGFNDPYDCAFLPNIRVPSDEEVEAIRQRYLQDSETPALVRAQFGTTSVEELRQLLLHAGRTALDQAVKDFMTKRGVSCFSGRHDDLLMWSHYGGATRGSV